MTGQEILTGIIQTDRPIHNILRSWVNTEQIPSVWTRSLSKVLKRYLQDVQDATDYGKNIDKRLENIVQRGNEIGDIIEGMIKQHHLNDQQLEQLKGPLVDRGKYAVAYAERRKSGVVIFDGASRQVN